LGIGQWDVMADLFFYRDSKAAPNSFINHVL